MVIGLFEHGQALSICRGTFFEIVPVVSSNATRERVMPLLGPAERGP
jgi:hypothetical protein